MVQNQQPDLNDEDEQVLDKVQWKKVKQRKPINVLNKRKLTDREMDELFGGG